MRLQNQPKGKSVIPSLNKEIIAKMDVSNLNGAASKHKSDNGKCSTFSTIPTGFMNASYN